MDRNRPLLLPLLQDVGEGEVVNILRQLLNKRIFESELPAKVEFPDLFRSSIVRSAQRRASEIDASRSNAQLLDEIASQFDAVDSSLGDAADPAEEAGDHDEVEIPKPPAKSKLAADYQGKISSLYPLYLLYQTQHLILNIAQRVLEECCFKFAEASMPLLLKEKR
ncbi:hypothetical protein VTK56DRAFT_5925 [Thermocarpiscus australiensis]